MTDKTKDTLVEYGRKGMSKIGSGSRNYGATAAILLCANWLSGLHKSAVEKLDAQVTLLKSIEKIALEKNDKLEKQFSTIEQIKNSTDRSARDVERLLDRDRESRPLPKKAAILEDVANANR